MMRMTWSWLKWMNKKKEGLPQTHFSAVHVFMNIKSEHLKGRSEPWFRDSIKSQAFLLHEFQLSKTGLLCALPRVLFRCCLHCSLTFKVKSKLTLKPQNIHYIIIKFLSDPGVPGVRSMGPDLTKWLQHYVEIWLMWLWLMRIATQYQLMMSIGPS